MTLQNNSNAHNANLSFEFIANACGIFIGKDGTRILCDPWLVDGVFEGSWCHIHKLKTTVDSVKDVDAIYVSHLHPDHYDERFFDFDRAKPIIVLDHGPNFLIKKLEAQKFTNIIKIKDGETVKFKEFDITMFAPFAKHNFHDTAIGNLIDSAMVIACNGIVAFNANDNTPTVEAGKMVYDRFGRVDLAMINYNAAGPYPSCFDNLTIDQKRQEHARLIERNFHYMRDVINEMHPKRVLPFAGAFVLGGSQHYKNEYLGTTTWDECASWLESHGIADTKMVVMRETDILDVEHGTSNRPYVPVDVNEISHYISTELAQLKYPYQLDEVPDETALVSDMEKASTAMKTRMGRYGIDSTFTVIVGAFGKKYIIYPYFKVYEGNEGLKRTLECHMDERLLRAVLSRRSNWNNAENGCHVSYIRTPNDYEPDLHTGLQFFHL